MLGVKKVSRGFTSLGSKLQKTSEGLGRKLVSTERKAIRGLGRGVEAVAQAERVLDKGLKGLSPVLTGTRQALRVGSQIAGVIPGGQGISAGLEYGARGFDEANRLSKQLRKADLQGMAGAQVARGLEKYGERRKALTRAVNQSSRNAGFM